MLIWKYADKRDSVWAKGRNVDKEVYIQTEVVHSEGIDRSKNCWGDVYPGNYALGFLCIKEVLIANASNISVLRTRASSSNYYSRSLRMFMGTADLSE